MSLKKNFYQALSELLTGEESAVSEPEKETNSRSDANLNIELQGTEPDQNTIHSTGNDIAADSAVKSAGKDSGVSNSSWRNPFTREAPSYKQSNVSSADLTGFHQISETTVISKNTLVVGDIRSLANVNIDGSIRGNVEVLKDVTMQGTLVGDLSCKSVNMQGSSVQGNVTTKECAYIDNNSTVLGNVAAQYASIDGKVKGNIQIGSKVEFHQNAIVVGDIYTSTISVEDGANIKGYINTTFLCENGDTSFPSQVIIEDNLVMQA